MFRSSIKHEVLEQEEVDLLTVASSFVLFRCTSALVVLLYID